MVVMTRGRALLPIVGIALVIMVCGMSREAVAQKAPQTSTCEECHSKVAVAFRKSVHTNAGVTCVTCHGGDSHDPQSSAMDPRKGFRGKPSRQEIPRFCASCHTDRAKMQQYGLETHQFEDYLTSVHGKAWARGDSNVAVCTDCHSSHDILAPEDPNSHVFPMNVAATCSKCHDNKALMDRYGLPSDVSKQYQSSVHAQVLAAGGRQSAPSCATCHGSHTALPPGAKDVPNICSRCHAQVLDLVKASPHAAAFAQGKMACDNCHQHHAIQHPQDKLLETSCTKCHAPKSAEAGVGSLIHGSIRQARFDYQKAIGLVKDLEKDGLLVTELYGRLDEAKMGLVEATRDQHTLDPSTVDKRLVSVEAVVDEVQQARVHANAEDLERKLLLIPLWLFAGMMAFMLYVKRRRSERAEQQHSAQ